MRLVRIGLTRGGGGVAALAYPLFLMVLSIGAGFHEGGDMTDIAGAVLGAMLFVIAAPTAWIFAFEFIDVSRFAVMATSVLTSFPVWYLVGGRMAVVSGNWGRWLSRYVRLIMVWTTFNIVMLGLVALVIG